MLIHGLIWIGVAKGNLILYTGAHVCLDKVPRCLLTAAVKALLGIGNSLLIGLLLLLQTRNILLGLQVLLIELIRLLLQSIKFGRNLGCFLTQAFNTLSANIATRGYEANRYYGCDNYRRGPDRPKQPREGPRGEMHCD